MGNLFSRTLTAQLKSKGFEFKDGHNFIKDFNTYQAKEIQNVWMFKVFLRKHVSHDWIEYNLADKIVVNTKGGDKRTFFFACRDGEIMVRMKNYPEEVKLQLGKTVHLNEHQIHLEYTFSAPKSLEDSKPVKQETSVKVKTTKTK